MSELKRFKRKKLRVAIMIDAVMRVLFKVARVALGRSPQSSLTEPPKKILVTQGGGVGDLVMSLPALAALQARFPKAVITVFAGPWAIDLLKGADTVQRVIGVQPPWLGRFSLSRAVRFWWSAFALRREGFDLGIDLQGDPRSLLFLYLTRSRQRVSYAWYGADMGEYLLTEVVPGPAPEAHLIERFLAVVTAIGCEADSRFPRMTVSEAERASAATWRRSVESTGRRLLVGVHPGAGNPLRLWNPARFAALLNRLVASLDVDVVVFAGPGEESAAAELVSRAGVGTVVSGISVRELAVRLSVLDCLVALDSSAAHIAAALGVSVVCLFGPTQPGFGGPVGEAVRSIQQGVFECRPCTQERCVHPEASCMDAISIDLVLQSVADMLQDRVSPKACDRMGSRL